MNKQNEKKISWCDMTLNPVVGCPRGCEYCYAKKLNDRFGWCRNCDGSIDFTCIEFFPERLKQLEIKKPKSIFMNSMSDIAFWEDEWANTTLDSMLENPQHKYIFLTKTYGAFFYMGQGVNVYNGATVTTQRQLNRAAGRCTHDWYSIEPLLEPLDMKFGTNCKMVIIGAETGNRKDKVIPKKEWITSIVQQCDRHGIRVFMKESIREIMGAEFRTDKLIWAVDR